MRPEPGSDRGFTKLWAASTAANLADGIVQTVVPLLAAALTRDPVLIAATLVAQRLPGLLFALPVGAYLDRVDRKVAMTVAGALRAGVMVLLAAAVAGWGLHEPAVLLPVLYGAGFLLGAAETVYDTAAQTIVPAVVAPEHLASANGRLFGTQTVAQYFAGPPLGGLLFALITVAPFAVNGVFYALGAVLVAAIAGSFRASLEPQPRRTLRSEIFEGLQWLWRDRLMRAFGLATTVLALCGSAVSAVLVLYAHEALGLGNVGFGLLLAAGAVGSFLGSGSAPGKAARCWSRCSGRHSPT